MKVLENEKNKEEKDRIGLSNFEKEKIYKLVIPFIYFFFLSSYFPNTTFFSTARHGDPVTHTCTRSIFANYHAPS